MNKPAPKEPSMDEILSSIRQIIADDDAAGTPRRPSVQAAPPPMQAAPARVATVDNRDLSDMLDDIEPLTLSPSQIVEEGNGGLSFEALLADTETEDPGLQLVEAEDIGFDPDDDLPSFDPAPTREPEPVRAPQPQPEVIAFRPQPEPVIAKPAPLPDPTLTSDMASELLEPATRAAVRGSIGKLNALGLGNPGVTIESMMRDMLRPMLKEWLDENLPSVVERMVEKEISRVARGE
ncbi:DUF2497 domain-containing protein [Devosia rhizoryzae]|uniref:DUF2497 domain-containing protein n=1 Tax=Devosia rhizoryzae TaxID=2774137 RepID=A0ABX7C9E1_9HYPH|nr:DUF2497 domain-containing protein [Devosia rhizoryzae]QQR40831.1 DUF2497 domain-containing protein [Devosia rhizoryzae]